MPRYAPRPLKRQEILHKPLWIRRRLPTNENYPKVKEILRESGLHTVCEEASCPNISECWGGGTATFMLMGDVCTRGCRFCNVKSGRPWALLDQDEPKKIADAVASMGLRYVVLTSVARDDLPDGGAGHLAEAIRAIHDSDRSILIEALIPDFSNEIDSLRTVIEASPTVIAHNIETTCSLTALVRDPRASYHQSLSVLRNVKKINRNVLTKSSIMLGLGESEEELLKTMRDLREASVDMLTLGQYLQPSRYHLPVNEYIPPEMFDRMREAGEGMGFAYVASGPLVRSSYRAGELFVEKVLRDRSVLTQN